MIAKCRHHRRRDTGGAPTTVRRRLGGVEVLHIRAYASDGALAAACLFGDLGVAQCTKLDHARQLLVLSKGQVWCHLRRSWWGLLACGPQCPGTVVRTTKLRGLASRRCARMPRQYSQLLQALSQHAFYTQAPHSTSLTHAHKRKWTDECTTYSTVSKTYCVIVTLSNTKPSCFRIITSA